ncbi:hypothetical protein HPB52_006386 [Rhipicephalus sanguineus]|uniref:Uncharacterized protein n=1 Tax=Rhipicephalus sanguineus TaxID=34632 RepID=A0A9D4Q564_RHISA|nr:hypothetical protein HPB52_006386 [Rhipicephalus sanguineus]
MGTSPEKTEYVAVIQGPKQRVESERYLVSIISRKETIRILGMQIDHGDGFETLPEAANKHYTLRCVLLDAYGGSRKRAFERLLELTLLKALRDLAEQQSQAGRVRLSTTTAGRQILQTLGYFTENFDPLPSPAPPCRTLTHLKYVIVQQSANSQGRGGCPPPCSNWYTALTSQASPHQAGGLFETPAVRERTLRFLGPQNLRYYATGMILLINGSGDSIDSTSAKRLRATEQDRCASLITPVQTALDIGTS